MPFINSRVSVSMTELKKIILWTGRVQNEKVSFSGNDCVSAVFPVWMREREGRDGRNREFSGERKEGGIYPEYVFQ